MTAGKCLVQLHPHGRKIEVNKGDSLLTSLYEQNIFLRSDCGGRGVCGKCSITVLDNDGTTNDVNCCSIHVEQDITIEIPVSSMLSPEVITKAPVTLPPEFLKSFCPIQTSHKYGIAVDLGTTTIATYLVATDRAEIVSSLSLKNPQAIYGDDVMSRISGILGNERNLDHLQTLVVKTIELGVQTLVANNQLSNEDLGEMVVVGNPAMIHLFLGVDPHSLGVAPYQPAFTEARETSSDQLGFTSLRLQIHTLPQVSGFIGGDLLSAAIAADICNAEPGTLLIDIGTNGELILKAESGLYSTSCATGPAFEGATLSCGMQAVSGAIDAITIDTATAKPGYTVLSPANKKNGKKTVPTGICGSGIISGVAELVRTGIIQTSGAFDQTAPSPSFHNDTENGARYTLYSPSEGSASPEVCISQKDIRSIQLGKAALITGIEFLLKKADVKKLERIIIAGAFGSHLDKSDMMTLGMLPVMEQSHVVTAGNLAGAGAVMALCDPGCREKAQKLASAVFVLELTSDPAFQKVFVERLHFPQQTTS